MSIGSLPYGKILYGSLFVVVLPIFLVVWTTISEPNVDLPAFGSFAIGIAVAFCGLALMISAMIAFMIYGNGLPMSPFPPARYVTRGIYRFMSHPIYTGFSILCIGVALAAESPSGLWLVSPVVLLGCAALVQGFEKHDFMKRFGTPLSKPLIHLPANEGTVPNVWDKLAVYVLVLLPWFVLYEAVRILGIPKDAIVAYFPFEMGLAVYEWTEIIYASTYIFVFLAPLLGQSRRDLRQFSISGLIATAIIMLLFVTIPLIAPPRPFQPHGFLGALLLFERANDTPAAAFPSFHVVWALLAARVYVGRTPSLKFLWWSWALLISASCITTGMHALVDVLGGFVVFFVVIRIQRIWELIRKFSERIANSWREWHFGPVRVINHGIYASIGTFVGLCIVGTLTGSQHVISVLIVAFSSLITSALWAQLIEGSPKLLRPYGYYGGVVGIVLGAFIAHEFGTSIWLLLAAFCVAGPWVQSFGRLRCLVQGCCHGREAPAEIGIRYYHPQSRVSKLAALTGVPIHPTPVYSILWNVLIAMMATRLWFLDASLALITGTCLILTGLGRFVEEAYRGEPQTPMVGGLRLYQWLAITSIVAGAVLTAFPATGESPAPHFTWVSAAAAAMFGLCTWFALGVDFPNSNKRFARLV